MATLSNLNFKSSKSEGEMSVVGSVRHDHFAIVTSANLFIYNSDKSLAKTMKMNFNTTLTGTLYKHWEMTTVADTAVAFSVSDNGKYFSWNVVYLVNNVTLTKTSDLTVFNFFDYFPSMFSFIIY